MRDSNHPAAELPRPHHLAESIDMSADAPPRNTRRARLRRWLLERLRVRAVSMRAGSAAMDGMRAFDAQLMRQLGRAVGLSERSALDFIDRAGTLHKLSGSLVRYLDEARVQSEAMQQGIERNSQVIRELAAFVQTIPAQIAQERDQLKALICEVKGLTEMTDTIRGIARQTEILAINAAIEAARAGDAGRGFAVLAGEVRRLATQANESAERVSHDIGSLVKSVESGYSVEFDARTRHNEAEAARLGGLTMKLDEGYVDMRHFYAMLMTAVTGHNIELDRGLGLLLDTAQTQDVVKQIIDRVQPAMDSRNAVLTDLIARLRIGEDDTAEIDRRAAALACDYLAQEALHRDPDAASDAAPGAPAPRIELF
jgi:methyl-accepting chemotaxis protein